MRQGRRLPRPRLSATVTVVIATVGVFALIISLVAGSS
jgi:hypothetical protein